jgi:hypothetical protein
MVVYDSAPLHSSADALLPHTGVVNRSRSIVSLCYLLLLVRLLLLLLLLPQAAMLQRTIPNRLHVWLLTNSIDLAPAEADNRQQQQQQLSPAVAAADARRRARQGTAIKEAAAAAATQAREPLAAADPRDTCLGRYPIINCRTQVRNRSRLCPLVTSLLTLGYLAHAAGVASASYSCKLSPSPACTAACTVAVA